MQYLILALIFLAVFMLLMALAKPKQREDVETRLKRLNEDDAAPEFNYTPEEEAPPAKKDGLADLNAKLDEVFTPLARKRVSEANAEALAKVIHDAGRYGMTPVELRTRQLKVAVILPFFVAIAYSALIGFDFVMVPLLIVICGVAGYFVPILRLRSEATARRNAILRELPSTLDLLTICVEAGLSLQAAMFKVVEKSKPSPLREELDQALREIQLGRPRGQALKDMAKRINLKEVNSVVLSMVQAEAMGTSVAKSLRVQSEIARENRWQRAQEKAFQAPVKLTFPLVLFIFPVVFIVIFGPIALQLMANWSSP
ncbi:MAG TPA: type II secretion system F family protein [Oscillatoriaceae cyanobacterium]